MPAKRSRKVTPKSATSALLITTNGAEKTMSWQQQTFNTLVTKVEKLRTELHKVSNALSQKLDFYLQNIGPLEADMDNCQTETVKVLYWHLKHTRQISHTQKNTLKELIASRLHSILMDRADEPEQELKEIFEAVEGITFEEAKDIEFRHMKDAMDAMFTGFGFDVDVENLQSGMTEEELARHTIKMQEQYQQQAEAWEEKEKKRKKSKKELALEQKEAQLEEARRKNISSIYKQLAKVLHPDLERDEDLKLQKEELMKQLTASYEKNDLHTLLTLELAWIKKEEKNTSSIANEKLAIYNEVLREQVFELEREIQMASENPRYNALLKLVDYPEELKRLNLTTVLKDKLEELRELQNDYALIKQRPPKDATHVKDMIKDFKFQQRLERQFDEFMNW